MSTRYLFPKNTKQQDEDASSADRAWIPFVRHIMENFNSLADQHQIDFKMITRLSSLSIWADVDKLEKILFNLLSNAFKYTPQGKQIRVVITDSNKDIAISVEDQGIGIPEHKQNSLFMRFESFDRQKFIQSVQYGYWFVFSQRTY